MVATLDPILSQINSCFSILILSSHLHLVLSSVVLPWGFLTHFDGISHIIFLCVNIVIMCRSVNYEVPQTQKSNILVERRMYFEFFTISLNHVLWMFSLLKKSDVLWSNFCIVPCGRFISSIDEDLVYQMYVTVGWKVPSLLFLARTCFTKWWAIVTTFQTQSKADHHTRVVVVL